MKQSRRGAIYARYSSDRQNDRSVEDQVMLCREFAERNGIKIVATYSDRAKSGASLHGRDGILEMLVAAKARSFDVLVIEDLDRLARDQGDLATIHKQFKFAGIEIEQLSGGKVNSLQVGLAGLMGQQYLEQLADKTKRGMAGNIREGKSAGGQGYGYRAVEGKPGELAIVEAEAEVVRRIFDLYLGGMAPRAIAGLLNRECVPAPRGLKWNASTINGNGKRGCGILRNSLYWGLRTWNKNRMVKNPDTGKRVSRANPESEWRTSEVPALAIITKEKFVAAQKIKADRSHTYTMGDPIPRKPRLLSGLLRCGCCGSGMVLHGSSRGRQRIGCSRKKESGTCQNRSLYYLDEIEQTVMTDLRKLLGGPEMLQTFVARYREAARKRSAGAARQKFDLERKLADLTGRRKRLLDLYERQDGVDAEETAARLKALSDEAKAVEAELELAVAAVPVIELHPEALAAFHRSIGALADRLNELWTLDPGKVAPFRQLVERVIVLPGHPTTIEVKGRLGALTRQPERVLRTVVAGEGVEPPTPGL